jgi:hypothetical protein
LGDCRNLFFALFLFFLANCLFPKSKLSESKKFTWPLIDFLGLIWIGWLANRSKLDLGLNLFFVFYSRVLYCYATDANNQSQGVRGRPPGACNYKNNILISIVKEHPPQGLEAWREVALAYQIQSGEATLCHGEDLRDNWIKKLCNRMQKPSGEPGKHCDRILHCIEIKHCIMDAARVAMLGVASAESGHSCNDNSSIVSSIVADSDVDAAADGGIGGDPQNNNNHISVGNEGDDEDNKSSFEVDDVAMACSCLQSLAMLIGHSAPTAASSWVSLVAASSYFLFVLSSNRQFIE